MPSNIIFVSHCEFYGNSALHLCSIASVLTKLGHSCAICVPKQPEAVLDHGKPDFQALDYEEAVAHGVSFPDNRTPDLVHAWTPREPVRKTTMALVQRYNIPYFVHLEDNERVLLLDQLPGWSFEDLERVPTCALDLFVPESRIQPRRAQRLLSGAAGVTALIDRLLECKPAHVPGMVFFPGYDADFAKIDNRNEELRAALGVRPEELLVVYTGNLHNSNFQEIRSLVLAVALVNRRGFRVKLVKAGLNAYVLPELSDPEIARYVIDRGFVTHRDVPGLLAAADVLVQPGPANAFNDYRFPSKLPEFLASGKPVILPRSNVGLLLKDGDEALVLEQGHSANIADALQRLAVDPQLRTKIGSGGRAFALQNLNWEKNISVLPAFYDDCLSKRHRAARPSIADEPPVPKLIAFYPPQFHLAPKSDAYGKSYPASTDDEGRGNFPTHPLHRSRADVEFESLEIPETMEAEATVARRFGVFGFCFYYYWFNGRKLLERPLAQFLEQGQPDFPFCICWANANWTRHCCGQERDVLIKQEYRDDLSVKFIRDVIPLFKDSRYMTVRGEPLLVLYRASLLPDPGATAEIWRAECRQAGISCLHLVTLQGTGHQDALPSGFDAAVEFPSVTRCTVNGGRRLSGIRPRFRGQLGDYSQEVIDELANRSSGHTIYRGVMATWQNPPHDDEQIQTMVNSSSDGYRTQLRRVTAQTMALADAQAPLIFINSWNNRAEGAVLGPNTHGDNRFLEATRAGLNEGFADYLRALGVRIDEAAIPNLLMPKERDIEGTQPLQREHGRRYKTANWFNEEQLKAIANRYRGRGRLVTAPLSYGTVRDFCDSVDNLRPIATANGDLKDNQRPWVLKAILSIVPFGGRILEIGAGEPFIADILDRLGYEVWAVDPYDGSGNGPVEYDRFRNECPSVRFVRRHFGEDLLSAPPGGFDCIYSISVLEHVPANELKGVFAGIKKYLRPKGSSIHAVDHVHKGRKAVEHYENLKNIIHSSGFEEAELTQLLERMEADPDTYYLSAESHNRWRASLPYDEFPMRVCVSIQITSPAGQLRVPAGGEI
jgi:glycosyltransferase involved in cell wall biosynthesis/2-polyprenyl-3-methyl-5-hydroxy-6-metoxy-1,4-benzoquinol methylase